jgi:hypothetical protein
MLEQLSMKSEISCSEPEMNYKVFSWRNHPQNGTNLQIQKKFSR